MNKIVKSIIVVIFLLVVVSCDETYIVKTDSFVYDYSYLSSIKLKQVDSQCLMVYFERERLKYCDNKHNSDKFHELAVKHNDLSYPGILKKVGIKPYFISAADVDFISFNVECKQKYDAYHLSKKSLNDIVKVLSITCTPFIKRKYKKNDVNILEDVSTEWLNYLRSRVSSLRASYEEPTLREGDYLFPIDKMSDELSTTDLSLIGLVALCRGTHKGSVIEIPLLHLYFTELPDIPGEYDITVKMEGDDGKIYSATTKMKF